MRQATKERYRLVGDIRTGEYDSDNVRFQIEIDEAFKPGALLLRRGTGIAVVRIAKRSACGENGPSNSLLVPGTLDLGANERYCPRPIAW